jgi:hypothetical protein
MRVFWWRDRSCRCESLGDLGMRRNASRRSIQLRALLMATDPIDMQPKLNFEAEEAFILQEMRELAMELRVEKSGCVADLKYWIYSRNRKSQSEPYKQPIEQPVR